MTDKTRIRWALAVAFIAIGQAWFWMYQYFNLIPNTICR